MAQTQAFFDDIQEQIIYEINKAKKSILIAVAWFTDREIFNLLCTKASEKIKVELLLTNDRINTNSGLDYEQLRSLGGFVTLIGNRKSGKSIMHNKFCVIDAKTIITGSYNWSYQAQQNQENITVIYDDHTLAEQFIDEFEAIKTRDGKKEKGGDHGKILFRKTLNHAQHALIGRFRPDLPGKQVFFINRNEGTPGGSRNVLEVFYSKSGELLWDNSKGNHNNRKTGPGRPWNTWARCPCYRRNFDGLATRPDYTMGRFIGEA